MPRQSSPADRRNASVGKAAAVLRAAAVHPTGASVSQLARAAGLPRATALRMIEALELERLLVRRRDLDLVLLGPAIFELASAGDADRVLIEAAREPMRRLAEATGEAVSLAVRRGDMIVGIDEIPGSHVIGPTSWVGRTWGLERTSTGRLASGEVPIGGVAESIDEVEPGLTSVAVAIGPRWPDAFLAVSGPTFRLDAAARRRIGDAALATAREIDAALAG